MESEVHVEAERHEDSEVQVDFELCEDSVLDDSASGPVVIAAPAPGARPLQGREPGPAVLNLNARQVRTLVSEQPELLERGLSIFAGGDGGIAGVDYETPMGSIHLLARDKKGSLVVVMVPEPGALASAISDVLQRLGWVRKHLAEFDQEVRGIVVVERLSEEVGYAAAGVVGMITFKAVRVALTFHDLTP